MATLKEHQAAMVDLLANGSGIPASASRLAHAMHDLIGIVMLQSAARENAAGIRALFGADDATTPGLNDKVLSKPQKAMKTDSPAKRPTPAEQRVKELENTIKQLKGRVAELKEQVKLGDAILAQHLASGVAYGVVAPEQAGCRKPDTQVCEHDYRLVYWNSDLRQCGKCGSIEE